MAMTLRPPTSRPRRCAHRPARRGGACSRSRAPRWSDYLLGRRRPADGCLARQGAERFTRCCAGSASDAVPHRRAGAPHRSHRRWRADPRARRRAARGGGAPAASERPRAGRLSRAPREGGGVLGIRSRAIIRSSTATSGRVARDVGVPREERRRPGPGGRPGLRPRRRGRGGTIDDVGEIAASAGRLPTSGSLSGMARSTALARPRSGRVIAGRVRRACSAL